MINIGNYRFEGPYYEATTSFNDVAVVYAILDLANRVIDVGETDKLKSRLANHERRSCWEQRCGKNIYVAALRMDNQEGRLQIEKIVRNTYNPTCGVV